MSPVERELLHGVGGGGDGICSSSVRVKGIAAVPLCEWHKVADDDDAMVVIKAATCVYDNCQKIRKCPSN